MGLNLYQAKSGAISFFFFLEGGKVPEIKVAQNGLKHILIFELLKYDEIFEISQAATSKQPTQQTTNHKHTDTRVTR